MSGPDRVRRRGGLFRFVGGVAVGLCALGLLGVALGVGLFAVGMVMSHFPSQPTRPPQLVLSGAEASRQGGAKVRLDLHQSLIRLDCHGRCDDLRMDRTDVQSIRVLDPRGNCVMCRRSWPFAPAAKAGPPLKIVPVGQ
jgi:hypothetical protein